MIFVPSKSNLNYQWHLVLFHFALKQQEKILQLKSSCFEINLEAIIYPNSVALTEASCCGSARETGTVERTGTLCWKTKLCKSRRL